MGSRSDGRPDWFDPIVGVTTILEFPGAILHGKE